MVSWTGSRRALGGLAIAIGLAGCLGQGAVTSLSTGAPGAVGPRATSPAKTAETARPKPQMVWLGDDFTAGVGAPTPDGSYARLTCAALGYRCYLDAQDGTGFVNWGTGSKTVKRTVHLPGRLWVDQANTDPDVVIVDAGRYDEKESRSATIAQLTLTLAAFTDLLKHPAQQSPRSDGKILVIYPFRLDAPVNTEYHRAMSAQFRAAAAEAHAAYVDPYTAGWFPPGLDYSAIAAPDGIHPNWLGQAYLAEQIVIALGKAGIAGT